MLSNTLAALLKLPAKDRVELAMALWESLTDAERAAELVLTPEQEAELESWQRHSLGRGAPEARERCVTPRLVFRPEAEAELLDARAWYEGERAGLGAIFAAASKQR